jgi:hypothetical protein
MVSEPFTAYEFNAVSEQDPGRTANGTDGEFHIQLDKVEDGSTLRYRTASTWLNE